MSEALKILQELRENKRYSYMYDRIDTAIKELLAQPEIRELLTQKREPLSEQVIWNANTEQLFEEGVRWAEKAHGIGVDNE